MSSLVKKIKHLVEHCGFILLIKILTLFNIENSAAICAVIARFIGPKLRVTKIVRKNLHIAFGEKYETEKIIENIWNNFGRFVGEFAHLLKIDDEEINIRVTIEGIENVIKLQQLGQPFFLYSGHFANWEFALKILNKLYPKFAITYRKANNPYINKVINKFRQNDKILLIQKGPNGARSLIKALKSGYSIAMLVDQKMNDGIEVPFFKRPSMTAHAIAKFALQFNYPVIPMQIVRTENSNFSLVIEPPLTIVKTENEEQDCYNIMLQINQNLEKWIEANVDQWFWFHNRWK